MPSYPWASVLRWPEGNPVVYQAADFDRSGQVVFADYFQYGTDMWNHLLFGVGGWIGLSTIVSAMSYGYCCDLMTGGGAGDTTIIQKVFAVSLGTLSCWGLDCFVHVPDADRQLFLQMVLRANTEYYTFIVNHNNSTNDLMYWDADGSYHVFASGVNVEVGDRRFHRMKLVCDLANKKYVRFVLNDLAYDLSAFSARRTIAVAPAGVEVDIGIISNLAAGRRALVDNAIVTKYEP